MTASRDELHHLIDELPDDQVPAVAEELRRRTKPRPAPSDKAFAWVGMGVAKNGRTDNARRVDEILAEGFGRD
jgi:hypothetical protein